EKKRLIGSLIYPIILLHGAILLPPLKYLVVESIGESYAANVLPPLLIAYGILGLGYFIWKKYCRSGWLREKIDEMTLKLPLIGKLARGLSLARVLGALASLHNAGIEPVRAARQAAQTAGNTAIGFQLTSALPVLESGGTFADYFSFSGVLPHMQLGMLSIAEQTGTLSESLERTVRMMEEENSQRITTTAKT
ncbi:MAG: hypothetical protein GY940_39030, partial [bacterium]|nr:hypothetical protein [bacterium]